jgi:hypothetical protein
MRKWFRERCDPLPGDHAQVVPSQHGGAGVYVKLEVIPGPTVTRDPVVHLDRESGGPEQVQHEVLVVVPRRSGWT